MAASVQCDHGRLVMVAAVLEAARRNATHIGLQGLEHGLSVGEVRHAQALARGFGQCRFTVTHAN